MTCPACGTRVRVRAGCGLYLSPHLSEKPPAWLVLDMDDGPLRREGSFAVARSWMLTCYGARVRERVTLGPHSYEYLLSPPRCADSDDVFLIREDAAALRGWDLSRRPLYPLAGDPFLCVDRDDPLPADNARG